MIDRNFIWQATRLSKAFQRRGCKTFCVKDVFRKDKGERRWQRRAS
jgi:hypothetical protein